MIKDADYQAITICFQSFLLSDIYIWNLKVELNEKNRIEGINQRGTTF